MDLPDFKNARLWGKASKRAYRKFCDLSVFRKVIIGSVVIALVVAGGKWWGKEADPDVPRFTIVNPHLRISEKVIIESENEESNVARRLKISIDGIVLNDTGIPVPKTEPQKWELALNDKDLPEECLRIGRHEIRVAFKGEGLSEIMEIAIRPEPQKGKPMDLPAKVDSPVRTIQVRTAKDLIREIGSNTVIELEEDTTYNLSLAEHIVTEHVSWAEVFDGFEPVIKGVYNLRIVGKAGTKLLIRPRYSWVLNFQNCSKIGLSDLDVGHVVGGSCQGGVLAFSESEDIEISRCRLFGSGTLGIHIEKVNHMKCNDLVISECTYGLLTVYDSSNITIDNSKFENSDAYDCISFLEGAYNILISNCIIRNNRISGYDPVLFHISDDTNEIVLSNSNILNNQAQRLVNKKGKLTLIDNNFEGNSFLEDTD